MALLLALAQSAYAVENASSVAYPVGELGESWQFPSDHLPIGMSVGDIHIAAWNTLNSRYIYHILTNQQGLLGSLIVDANVPSGESSPITLREALIIEQVLEMIAHSERPRALIALQEVGEKLFEELKRRLPPNMAVATASPDALMSGDIFIYDTTLFDFVSLRTGVYEAKPSNTYMTLTLLERKSGLLYHFVQSHVPAAPGVSGPARKEWAEEILYNFDPNALTVVMGDMNRSPDFLLKDFREAAVSLGLSKQPLSMLWIPYPTHIDTLRRASWIDNFFFYNPYPHIRIAVEDAPQNLFSKLSPPFNLLKSLRPCHLDVSFDVWCQLKIMEGTVVCGALGSGKTEQIKLALKNEPVLYFNLQEKFLEHYFNEHKIFDPEVRQQVRSQYPNCGYLHELEREWIRASEQEIFSAIMSHGAAIIVFDDLDIINHDKLCPDKEKTALRLVDIADRLRRQGKKVVFIVHRQSLSCRGVWDELQSRFSVVPENLVRAEYFTVSEEKALLGKTLLGATDSEKFRQWAMGNPAAYKAILLRMIATNDKNLRVEISFDTLAEEAIAHVNALWKTACQHQPEWVVATLERIASGESTLLQNLEEGELEVLKSSGLVGLRSGKFAMPTLVKDVILAFPFEKSKSVAP